MILENWLYTGLIGSETQNCPPLKEDIECEYLVIGGGFTGLHATLELVENGKKVILVEKTICGGSSSGKSGGFITPESEHDNRILEKHYGKAGAKIISNIPQEGLNLIQNTIKKYKLKCDFRKQDSLYLAHKESDIKIY